MALLRAAQMHGSYDVRPLGQFGDTFVSHQDFVSTGLFNEDYVEQAIYVENSLYEIHTETPTNPCWFHCDYTPRPFNGGSNPGILFTMTSPDDDIILALRSDNLDLYLDVYIGGSPVTIHGPVPVVDGVYTTIDIGIQMSSGGNTTIWLYIDDALAFSIVESYVLHAYEIQKVKFPVTGTRGYVSQCIVADENTAGWRLSTLSKSRRDVPGNDRDWVGTPSSLIDGVLFLDDDYDETRFMSTGSPGARSNAKQVVSIPSTGPQKIAGVVVAMTAENDPGSNVSDISPYFTINDGVVILGGMSFPKDGAKHYRNKTVVQNPVTSAPWVPSALDEAFIGVLAL